MSLFSSFHRWDSVWRSPDMPVSQRPLRTLKRQDYNRRLHRSFLPREKVDHPYSHPQGGRGTACVPVCIWDHERTGVKAREWKFNLEAMKTSPQLS